MSCGAGALLSREVGERLAQHQGSMTLPARDDLLGQPVRQQVGVVPAQGLQAPAHALYDVHVPFREHRLQKVEQCLCLRDTLRSAARTLGPEVDADPDGPAHPAVAVLAPGRELHQCWLEVGYQPRAGYPLPQDVRGVPGVGGDDEGPAAGESPLIAQPT